MIIIKDKNEIKIMREGGRKLAHVLNQIISRVKSGATTAELEELGCRLIKEAGGKPAFKNYYLKHEDKYYPTALCASINNEIVHAPSLPARLLKEGDIIGIDIGMVYPARKGAKGYYTDTAATVGVGRVSPQAAKLIAVAEKSLSLAISAIKPEIKLSHIGKIIQDYVEANGFSVVRDLVGHGVGTDVHEDPQIPHYYSRDNKVILKPGMTLAIEPMINIGKPEIKTLPDGFTIATRDGSLSAQFEHTIAVTETGYEILTRL